MVYFALLSIGIFLIILAILIIRDLPSIYRARKAFENSIYFDSEIIIQGKRFTLEVSTETKKEWSCPRGVNTLTYWRRKNIAQYKLGNTKELFSSDYETDQQFLNAIKEIMY